MQCLDMFLKVSLLSKCLVTQMTSKRSFSSVDSKVIPQKSSGTECLVAQVARLSFISQTLNLVLHLARRKTCEAVNNL